MYRRTQKNALRERPCCVLREEARRTHHATKAQRQYLIPNIQYLSILLWTCHRDKKIRIRWRAASFPPQQPAAYTKLLVRQTCFLASSRCDWFLPAEVTVTPAGEGRGFALPSALSLRAKRRGVNPKGANCEGRGTAHLARSNTRQLPEKTTRQRQGAGHPLLR